MGALPVTELAARRERRIVLTTGIIYAVAVVLVVMEMCLGNTNYAPSTVLSVLMGEQVKGASYAIIEVRLPRTIAAVLCGMAFGVGGNVFQTMLRNPLASPDVIGLSSGASVVAVFCILVLGMGPGSASLGGLAGSLAAAGVIYGLSQVGGFSEGKLILVGIAMQSLFQALISAILIKGATDDVPQALRWLSGSLSGVGMGDIAPLAPIVLLLAATFILMRQLKLMELGDEFATTLGVAVGKTRAALVACAVGMVALATSVTGPIACVALLSGPIATRIVSERSAATAAAGGVGVVLVLAADLVGHFLLGTRFPAGVITGLLGTPYLLWLLVSLSKKGAVQ